MVEFNGRVAALNGKALATTGIESVIGVNASGGIVRSSRAVFNVKDYGALGDNTTNDAAAIQAAIDAAEANGGGVVYFPKPASRYKVNSTLTVQIDGVSIEGEGRTVILDFAAATAGPGLQIGGVFHFSVRHIAILNSYTHGIEIVGGSPHTFAAYGHLLDVYVRGARNGSDNIRITNAFMVSFIDIFTQNGTRGIVVQGGFSTTLNFSECYSYQASSHGVYLENIMGFTWVNGASDQSTGGYGFYLKDCSGEFNTPYAEFNNYSMFGILYDSTTTNLMKGVRIAINTPQPYGNNWDSGTNAVKNASVGHFITTAVTGSGAASNAAAGTISIKGFKEFQASLPGKDIDGPGAFRYTTDDMSRQALTWGTSISFAVNGDGATDVSYALPVNITGANTRIATLGPKLRNGVSAYGGLIVITASANTRASGSRTATYVLSVNKASAGTAGEISLISSIGNDAGANAADASFTFTFDAANNELEATVVASTATGNWYFHIACIGNISAVVG